MQRLKYFLFLIIIFSIIYTVLLYKNIIKLPIGPNYMILDFINDYSIDENLVSDYENIFVVKILKNNWTSDDFPSTDFEAENLYNIKWETENKIILKQQWWYNWGILTIQKWDKLMKEWEIYLIASNYNEDNDYYVVSWHENWKILLNNEDINFIKSNKRIKELENILNNHLD